MSFKDKTIKIADWTGNQLFIGDYDDSKVDEVLDANRCKDHTYDSGNYNCDICDDTGYIGIFTVSWVDESDKKDCNVYEYINY